MPTVLEDSEIPLRDSFIPLNQHEVNCRPQLQVQSPLFDFAMHMRAENQLKCIAKEKIAVVVWEPL